MTASPAYIPGLPPARALPLIEQALLGRYLPPIPDGVGPAWLAASLPPGSWVLDPFGASPRLAVEAARAGCRLLVAANNPIARFLIELYAAPPSENDLRSALAELSSSTRAGERLEPHLRALYQTECAQCGRLIEAQAFVWERGAPSPDRRIYRCPYCKDEGDRPATAQDARRAAQFSASGLHHARALERVAPMDDPDRLFAEEAMAMYLPRAVYALFTLINKIESFPPARRKALSALLLSVFDQANVLWHFPSERSRPRQLIVPPRFLEKNIWLALEDASAQLPSQLSLDLPPLTPGPPSATSPNLPVASWPDLPPPSGGICLYEGRLKDLAAHLISQPERSLRFDGVLAALPRPNQAYWTLSALWSGWLWGHAASEPFHSMLRRRRYDWAWHSVALRSVFASLGDLLKPDAPCLGLIGETETGFLSASLLAAELSGFDLEGIAMRLESGAAQIHWRRSAVRAYRPAQAAPASVETLQGSLERAGLAYLRQRGEPAVFASLHAAGMSALVQERLLAYASPTSPADLLHKTEEAFKGAFSYRAGFSRYTASSHSPESGHWWLDEVALKRHAGPVAPPLADRVEMELVRYLQKHPACTLEEVDQALCAVFPGQSTPDFDLVAECSASYGEHSAADLWSLRPQDDPRSRRADIKAMRNLLIQIGSRLSYRTPPSGPLPKPADPQPVLWISENGSTVYVFYVLASAVLGRIVSEPSILSLDSGPASSPDSPLDSGRHSRQIIVLPGGRAGLVGFKMRQDPRLRLAIETGWRFIKFRHLRWIAENENLTRDNLDSLIDTDPLASQDPQLPLL